MSLYFLNLHTFLVYLFFLCNIISTKQVCLTYIQYNLIIFPVSLLVDTMEHLGIKVIKNLIVAHLPYKGTSMFTCLMVETLPIIIKQIDDSLMYSLKKFHTLIFLQYRRKNFLLQKYLKYIFLNCIISKLFYI